MARMQLHLLLSFTVQLFWPGGALQYAPEIIDDFLMPNQRRSVDDCHFRYIRYVKPEEGTPSAAGGRQAYLREFAHMAAIGWSNPDGTTLWNCGGSLIWENYILTAAHCAADNDNVAPDVARFADINLYDDGDDEFAQQRKIVEIIRHPEHLYRKRYHDIALMRLDTNIRLHATVAPACLWNENEVRFKSLEATGWGDTGYAQNRSPNLLKVLLRPVDRDRCSVHYENRRGLRAGLHANQMCAGDPVMDTCPGDSGGPLQIKLMHNNRMTSFIVGVTSFGTACGLSVPGIYTRVAPYIPWIRLVLSERGENVTEWMFEPQNCALRYRGFREYEPGVRPPRSGPQTFGGSHTFSFEQLYFEDANLVLADAAYQVTIHWNETTGSNTASDQCHGVIIDDTTVLTLASCTEAERKPPSHIRYDGGKTQPIASYFTHPEYKENSLYYNIGLLKLKKPVKFSYQFYPACPWYRTDVAATQMKVSGRGIKQLNQNDPHSSMVSSNETAQVQAIGYAQNDSTCSLPPEYALQLGNGLNEEHVCFGSDLYLLPGTCSQSLGGPVHSEVRQWRRVYTYLHALALLGRDCGYGESAVGVSIAAHKDWLQSILMSDVPGEDDESDEDSRQQVVFLNHALAEGDLCAAGRGSDGICVDVKFCPNAVHDFHTGKEVKFCQTGSLVCCPQHLIRNGTDTERKEIDECGNGQALHLVQHFDKSQVSIVWNVGIEAKTCIGTIITSRTIVAAANCVNGLKLPAQVQMRYDKTTPLESMEVERIILHPDFDISTKQHNIALVQMRRTFDATRGKVPACLWTNTTHTPFEMTQVLLNTRDAPFEIVFPRYSSECTEPFARVLERHELCLDVQLFGRAQHVNEDAPALWSKYVYEHKFTTYLVGIANQISTKDGIVLLHTRISSYVGWIKSVL